MQNKLYTIFSPPDDQFAVRPWAAITEPQTFGFCEFCKTHEKDLTPIKIWTPGEERIWTHGKREKKIHAPQPTAIH